MTLEEYIGTHIDVEPPELVTVNRRTHLYHPYSRMCSGHFQGRLLRMFVAMIRPVRVLEIGAFTGYSAMSIAEGLPPGGVIHTVEKEDELEDTLRNNFSTSPRAESIVLHIGNIEEIITQFDPESFDMVFIDANKRHYPDYYELVFPFVSEGGFIIADNTLWDGHVLEDSAVSDSQTVGIMKFNDMVAADNRVEKVIIPVRDGITVIRKKYSVVGDVIKNSKNKI